MRRAAIIAAAALVAAAAVGSVKPTKADEFRYITIAPALTNLLKGGAFKWGDNTNGHWFVKLMDDAVLKEAITERRLVAAGRWNGLRNMAYVTNWFYARESYPVDKIYAGGMWMSNSVPLANAGIKWSSSLATSNTAKQLVVLASGLEESDVFPDFADEPVKVGWHPYKKAFARIAEIEDARTKTAAAEILCKAGTFWENIDDASKGVGGGMDKVSGRRYKSSYYPESNNRTNSTETVHTKTIDGYYAVEQTLEVSYDNDDGAVVEDYREETIRHEYYQVDPGEKSKVTITVNLPTNLCPHSVVGYVLGFKCTYSYTYQAEIPKKWEIYNDPLVPAWMSYVGDYETLTTNVEKTVYFSVAKWYGGFANTVGTCTTNVTLDVDLGDLVSMVGSGSIFDGAGAHMSWFGGSAGDKPFGTLPSLGPCPSTFTYDETEYDTGGWCYTDIKEYCCYSFEPLNSAAIIVKPQFYSSTR